MSHAAVLCARTDLPLAWRIETARRNESLYVAPLLDSSARSATNPRRLRWTRGYDNNRYRTKHASAARFPIVCLREGRPIPLTPIPYGADEWKRLYRGRSAVERSFGRLKNEYGLAPLRVRGLARVQLHADLCMRTRLGLALTRARAVPLAANPSRIRPVSASHWRCFWRRPLGHRWENIVDRTYAYRRCRECGKTTPLGSKGKEPPPNLYGGHD